MQTRFGIRSRRTYRLATLLVLTALLAGTMLVRVPAAQAWMGYSAWYSNRTTNSVAVFWTARGQEDAPSTASDQVRLCWTTDPSANPCNSNQITLGQWLPVGSTNYYGISGLKCWQSYRVLVAQSYLLSQTWDWDEQTINVSSGGGCSGGWTGWYDRDDPSGDGDWEILVYLNPVCSADQDIVMIEAQTTYGLDWRATGEVVTATTTDGLYCRNQFQSDGQCEDYRVRFYCSS